MSALSGPINCTILAIYGPQQKSPKWCSFWGHKLPGNGNFWCQKQPKRSLFISGAINCQNGPVYGAINCKKGRQNLYGLILHVCIALTDIRIGKQLFHDFTDQYNFKICVYFQISLQVNNGVLYCYVPQQPLQLSPHKFA